MKNVLSNDFEQHGKLEHMHSTLQHNKQTFVGAEEEQLHKQQAQHGIIYNGNTMTVLCHAMLCMTWLCICHVSSHIA